METTPLLSSHGSPSSAQGPPRASDPERPASITSESPFSDASDSPSRSKSSASHTFTNVTNMLLGIGILALPRAFSLAGWIGGLALLFGCCAATTWTASMLARCMDATEPPAQTYAEIGRSAFGRPGELFVGLIVAVDLLIVCVTYLILCVDEIGVLWQEFKGRWVYLGVGVAGVPLAILRNMRVLSYVGVFGVLSILLLLFTLLLLGFLPIPPHPGPSGSILNPSPTFLFPNSPGNLPVAFGIIMAALAGHIVLPTLKREMRDERSFLPSVSAGYAAVLLIYLLFSSAGYLMFGSATLPEITMNLSQLADRGIYPKWITTTCAAIFVVNPLSKVGVVLEVLGGIVEAWVGGAIGSIGDSRDRIEGRERVVVERVFVLPAEQGRWSVSPPALSDEGAFLDNERDLIDDPETPVVESSDSEDPDELLDHMKIVRALHAVSAPDDEIVDIETGEPDERSPLVPSIEFIRPRIPPNLPVTRQTPPFQSTFVSPALSTGIRMGLLALSISLASLLPSFLHASVLLGCMLSTTTAVLFPCVCYLSICGEGLGWFEKLGVGMVFAAGLLGAIWGSIEVWRIGG